jgi:hypothetical protein
MWSRGGLQPPNTVKAEVLGLAPRKGRRSCAGHPHSRVVRQWSFQFESLRRVGQKPQIDLCRCRQDDRHGLRMNGRDDGVRVVVRKPNSLCCPPTAALFGPRTPRQGVHRPAKAKADRHSRRTKVAGTMQRFRLPSHPRQCGLPTLRILVIGAPPNCGERGIPQRAMTAWPGCERSVPWSGRIPGNRGRLRVRSCRARNQSRIADWPLVGL